MNASPAVMPWQQRVLDEEKDLAEKLAKLDTYIAAGGCADKYENEMLKLQAICMHGYHAALKNRIAHWGLS